MIYKPALDKKFNLLTGIHTSVYKAKNYFKNPDYFTPNGCNVFCGEQGSGKTYSAVSYVYNLMQIYPKCICVTNMDLYGLFDPMRDRIHCYTGVHDLTRYTNDIYGVIFLIDELHLEFNSLESKNLPISLFTQISQQRKQRKTIVGTSQLYSRLAKPFREQMDHVVGCKCILGVFQYNVVLDGWTLSQNENRLSGKCVRKYWLCHDTNMYDSFDTYAVIKRVNAGGE